MGKWKRKIWTAEEKEFFRLTYPDLPTAEVAAALGRSLLKTYAAAKRFGLKKSPAYLASPDACRLRRGDNVGEGFRFLPGHVPANKGLRRPGYAPGRMRKTQFKKGEKPGNTLPIGTVRLNGDGYMRIKISDAPEPPEAKGALSKNWEFVHRRVWEKAHGPIPKGHRLWWKDGNHLNCALENLELLTDQEHMARTTVHNLPRELKDTIQLAGRLKRAIRRRTKADAVKESVGRSAESSVRNN